MSHLFARTAGPLVRLIWLLADYSCLRDGQLPAFAVAIIVQQVIYPVTDAPKYRKAFLASLETSFCICGTVDGYSFVRRTIL